MLNSTIKIIPYPKDLCQPLPEIKGNVDYNEYQKIMESIDRILLETGIEKMFMQSYIQECIDKEMKNNRQKFNPLTDYRQGQ
jgi:hypothetical protein